MSKRFMRQDYFRYKRVGTKWRRPRGIQSKMKIGKGGAGSVVSIGYGTPNSEKNKFNGANVIIVYNVNDLKKVGDNIALIGSTVGARKTSLIREEAKKLDIRILNANKARRGHRLAVHLEKTRTEKRKTKQKKREEKKAAAQPKEEKKEGKEKQETKQVKTEHAPGTHVHADGTVHTEHHHDSLKQEDHAGEVKGKKPVRPESREEKK